MKFLYILLIVILANASLAEEKKEVFKPPLGSCSEYTDYYIYKCQPFKCSLNIAKIALTSLEMQVVGMNKDNLCEYNYKYNMRNPKFPPAEIKMKCSLSEAGALEMANQFTQYKNGDLNVYISPPYNEILSKECGRY